MAGGVAVVFSGYLRDVPAPHTQEPEFILARYVAEDWSWLRTANGVFAFAIVDERRDRCVLAVDRLGMRPLFFTHDDTGVAFADGLEVLLPWWEGSREIDYDAVQESLVLGFPLGDRTFLRSVERVPAGTWVVCRRGSRRTTRYWSLEELPPLRRQDPERFLDESRTRFRHGLERLLSRCSEGALCLLSSGHDSRRILLEGRAIGARFDTVTAVWPYAGRAGMTIDRAVVQELCGRLGIRHRLVAVPGDAGALSVRIARHVRDVLLGFQVYGPYHIWAVPLVASLQTSDRLRNFDGIAGDTFFNNPFYGLPRGVWGRARPDREVLDAIAPDREAWDRMWDGLVSRSLSSRLEEALEALPEGPQRLSFFYLMGRTRRMVALLPYGLLNLRIESFCPYLDNDVMEHALTLDPVLKGELRGQRMALNRHFPNFADIPSSHSLPAEVPARYFHAMRFVDPDFVGRFTVAELSRLLRARLWHRPLPRVAGRDLVFACLSTLGLGSIRGRWREPRLRDLLHTSQLLDMFGRNTPQGWTSARESALAYLDARPAPADDPGGGLL